jgi:prolyl-tRNA synthetase
MPRLTSRAQNYSEWYNDLVRQADLADHSPVKGCMVIKPYGYALWEKMQQVLDGMFKATGHVNAYFPLFIPKSFLSKEAEHIEGFAKECAVVTHYRLKKGAEGEGLIVDPEAKLEEELIVRPTSETIIWNSYRDWIRSYRDLPLLINQWANVVRWEMRTRFFLRTTEFLWQEGHTAHATEAEAVAETEKMLGVYADFVENHLAIPVIRGVKTPNERFPGAVETYCIEALMQDGKALQAGTSHFLGQNFARAFDVKFMTPENSESYVWATSWGVSTRLIGGLIMAHSDDAGLVLPPKLAPIQVVIVPIYKTDAERSAVLQRGATLAEEIKAQGVSVKIDDDRQRNPGWKFAEWELKGVPIRISLGPRDLAKNQMELARRDTGTKTFAPLDEASSLIPRLLNEIQSTLYQKALAYREAQTHRVDDFSLFKERLEAPGGFLLAHWDGTSETELAIKEETKATIRCIPLDAMSDEPGKCVYTGRPSPRRVLFAKAY